MSFGVSAHLLNATAAGRRWAWQFMPCPSLSVLPTPGRCRLLSAADGWCRLLPAAAGAGRDPAGLLSLSGSTGVKVVMAASCTAEQVAGAVARARRP